MLSADDRAAFEGLLDEAEIALAGDNAAVRVEVAEGMQALADVLQPLDSAAGATAVQVEGLLGTMDGIAQRLRG